MSVGAYRIDQRCCACCRWWNGSRTIDFNGGSLPRYVKAEAGQFGRTISLDVLLRDEAIPYGYKFTGGNLGVSGKKITLPHCLAIFV